MRSILLKNGTALIHDDNDQVDAVETDILIEGDKIVTIAKDISAPGAEVIDCSDKLISPGYCTKSASSRRSLTDVALSTPITMYGKPN